MVKLSLDAGLTCPNRDGRSGTGGCIYCSESGSGDFASDIPSQIRLTSRKWPDAGYLAYFQNHTNTYAPVSFLRKRWDDALSHPQIKGLVIATRPDCLPDEIIELLKEYNAKTFLWVELGLQTESDVTAQLINRCYPTSVFVDAMERLQKAGIRVVVHEILGLPGETRKQMMKTAAFVNSFHPFGIKLHMLHIMKDTALGEIYRYQCLSGSQTLHQKQNLNEGHSRNAKQSQNAEHSQDAGQNLRHQQRIRKDPKEQFPADDRFMSPDTDALAVTIGFPQIELLSLQDYVSLVVDILEQTPPDITIHRLTGDAPRDKLLAPDWTSNKHVVLGAIQHEFSVRGSFQGVRTNTTEDRRY